MTHFFERKEASAVLVIGLQGLRDSTSKGQEIFVFMNYVWNIEQLLN